MKRTTLLMAVLVLAVFIFGCGGQVSERECITDSDCVVGGCSGTVCQSKNTELVFTTCEYLPEYACYKQISCKCIENKCGWDKTQEFEGCLLKAREALNK